MSKKVNTNKSSKKNDVLGDDLDEFEFEKQYTKSFEASDSDLDIVDNISSGLKYEFFVHYYSFC